MIGWPKPSLGRFRVHLALNLRYGLLFSWRNSCLFKEGNIHSGTFITAVKAYRHICGGSPSCPNRRSLAKIPQITETKSNKALNDQVTQTPLSRTIVYGHVTQKSRDGTYAGISMLQCTSARLETCTPTFE